MPDNGASPLRIGVIGCGRIAQVAHLPAIAKSPSVRLMGISDPSSTLVDAVSRRYDVPGFTDTGELLDGDLDAVLIAVPDRFHLGTGLQALEAGKHVLVEKPAAATSAEATELLQAAAKHQRKLQVGAMRRHDPGIQYAKRAMKSIGPILSATFWYRLPTALRVSTEAALFPAITVDQTVRTREAEFKADRAAYLLRTHGAHVFDTMRYLLGDAVAVRAEMARSGADLHWQGSVRTYNALAAFEITANVHSDYSEGVEIFGELGHLRIRSYFPFYRRSSAARVFDEKALESRAPDYGAVDPYQRQLEAFAATVTEDGQTDPDGVDGLEALRLIEATARSVAVDGNRVAV